MTSMMEVRVSAAGEATEPEAFALASVGEDEWEEWNREPRRGEVTGDEPGPLNARERAHRAPVRPRAGLPRAVRAGGPAPRPRRVRRRRGDRRPRRARRAGAPAADPARRASSTRSPTSSSPPARSSRSPRRGASRAWLPALVVARDLAQLAGAAVLRTTHHAVPVAPTRIGKYATVGLAMTVVLALAGDFGVDPGGDLGGFVVASALLAAECVALSFAQYTLFFVRAFRAAPAR